MQQQQPVSQSRSTISVTKAVSQLEMRQDTGGVQTNISIEVGAPYESGSQQQRTVATPTRSKINLNETVITSTSAQRLPMNKSQRQLSISEQSMYNQSDNSIVTNPLQSINPQELEKQLNNSPYVNGGVEINYSTTRPATAYAEKQLFSQTQNLMRPKGVFHLRSNRPVKQMAEIPLLVIQPNSNNSPERPQSIFQIKGYSRPSTAISRNSHLQRPQTNYTQADVAQKLLLSRSFRALSKGNHLRTTLFNKKDNNQDQTPQFFTKQLKLNQSNSPKKQMQALRANVIQQANLHFTAPLSNLRINPKSQYFENAKYQEHRLAVVIPLVIGGGLNIVGTHAIDDVYTRVKVSKRGEDSGYHTANRGSMINTKLQ
ncbi:hypothetical protein FGO68_gene6509 [Halteria grandinella]|uniref:Uncharacterized protein n=1 Tax=Halteria grandinella TaxID=5974 RepID=A0A8J8P5B3_HALGN|nr:hypothetical protein FGO68_gene6509 [Halteria grandinella]